MSDKAAKTANGTNSPNCYKMMITCLVTMVCAKLIIFTEHRDTLRYLTDKIRSLLGNDKAVINIHGGMLRDERRKVEELFMQEKDVRILIATDAAGEVLTCSAPT